MKWLKRQTSPEPQVTPPPSPEEQGYVPVGALQTLLKAAGVDYTLEALVARAFGVQEEQLESATELRQQVEKETDSAQAEYDATVAAAKQVLQQKLRGIQVKESSARAAEEWATQIAQAVGTFRHAQRAAEATETATDDGDSAHSDDVGLSIDEALGLE